MTEPSLRPPSLALHGVGKSFPAVRALHDVSIEARSGEVLALMGENGAGKSTLLKILSGAYRPDRGRIEVDGVEVNFRSPQDSRAAGIRVVYQEPDIVPGTSVAENLFLGELPRSWGRVVDRRRLNREAEALLSTFRFGRSLRPDGPADRMSPAQRQMVEILRALRVGVKVLALDEPTSSLSEAEAEDLFGVIAELRAKGVALIYVSHRMNEILRLADRVTVLRDGQHVGTLPAGELDEPTLIRMMVGRPLSEVMKQARHATPRRVLEVRNLTSDDVTDISLSVHAGEVVGLAGLVGAGRTELAKTIFGALPRRSGEIYMEGRAVEIRSPRDAIDAGIAYAPEERKADALLLDRSVLENGTLAVTRRLSHLRVVDRARERALMEGFAERLRIKTPSLNQLVGKLSGGNQQKVVLARWLAAEPKLLILDEPTRGVDVGAKAEIYALIEELAKEGLAVLLISSELPEILGLSDRIICLRAGRIVGELPAETATEESVLQLCIAQQPTHEHAQGVHR